jgi:hypothetical protein
MTHEERAVRGVLGYADRALNPVAAGKAGAVVAQKAIRNAIAEEAAPSSLEARERID